MKERNLTNTLRGIFVFLEGFVVLFFVLLVVLMVILISSVDSSKSFSVGEARIEIPSELYSLSSESIVGGTIRLDKVRGHVDVVKPQNLGWYKKRLPFMFVVSIAFCGGLFLILEFFRRLFQSVGRGEAFTPASVGNLHKIGTMIILLNLVGPLLASWWEYDVANFLDENIEATGIEVDFGPTNSVAGFETDINDVVVRVGLTEIGISSGNFLLRISFVGIFLGMMILGIGEAFRQGLKLKEENELTI